MLLFRLGRTFADANSDPLAYHFESDEKVMGNDATTHWSQLHLDLHRNEDRQNDGDG